MPFPQPAANAEMAHRQCPKQQSAVRTDPRGADNHGPLWLNTAPSNPDRQSAAALARGAVPYFVPVYYPLAQRFTNSRQNAGNHESKMLPGTVLFVDRRQRNDLRSGQRPDCSGGRRHPTRRRRASQCAFRHAGWRRQSNLPAAAQGPVHFDQPQRDVAPRLRPQILLLDQRLLNDRVTIEVRPCRARPRTGRSPLCSASDASSTLAFKFLARSCDFKNDTMPFSTSRSACNTEF